MKPERAAGPLQGAVAQPQAFVQGRRSAVRPLHGWGGWGEAIAGGFTLIELAVVVAIVGVLAAMAMPFAETAVQRAREAELRAALRQIRGGLDAYKRAFDEGRIARGPADSGYPKRLEQLVDGVIDIKRPDGARIYFLRRLPRDPFHPDPSLPAADTWGKRAYASPPDAPFEGEDVFDVYSLSGRVGLNGIPYRDW